MTARRGEGKPKAKRVTVTETERRGIMRVVAASFSHKMLRAPWTLDVMTKLRRAKPRAVAGKGKVKP